MKGLMAKFKKDREFRRAPTSLPSQPSAAQLSRKGTGKVLILDSRASSRLLHNSSRVTPLSSARANEARLTQRKLVFPGHGVDLHHSSGKPKKRMASCSLASRRVRSPDETTPIIAHKACSRVRSFYGLHINIAVCMDLTQKRDEKLVHARTFQFKIPTKSFCTCYFRHSYVARFLQTAILDHACQALPTRRVQGYVSVNRSFHVGGIKVLPEMVDIMPIRNHQHCLGPEI